jgi:hypothetical protein
MWEHLLQHTSKKYPITNLCILTKLSSFFRNGWSNSI